MIEMLQVIFYCVWMIPLIFALMGITAYIYLKFTKVDNSTELLIIQITTIGNETVNKIINTIRDYNLKIPYEIWVVSDEGDTTKYKNNDLHILVPDSFKCKAEYKARAMEYARLFRKAKGLVSRNIMLVLIDDDSIPSKEIIQKTFTMPYDIANGISVPRNVLNKFTLIENIRTYSCTAICGVFQGILHFPIWVHGECLCVRSSVEQSVTWDWHSLAEDLVFGHEAVRQKFKFGMLWADVNVSPPLRFNDIIIQRRRWFWGIAHAIRYLLPWKAKVLLISMDVFGFTSFVLSISGMILLFFDVISRPTGILLSILYLSFIVWIAHYMIIGFYVSKHAGLKKNICYALVSVISIWYTTFSGFVLILTSIFKKPNSFEVIEKKL